MALLPDVFVPEDEDDNAFPIMDAGWVEAELVGSTYKQTNAKDGNYFEMKFKVIEEGSFAGTYLYTNFNWINKNPTAVRIGKADMKKLCNACGHEGDLEDTEDLHEIPLMVKVSVKAATDQWPAKNEIKDFKAVD